MRVGVLIAAILLGFLGLLFTETFIGAIIGLPMLLIGLILFLYGLFAKGEPRMTAQAQVRIGEPTREITAPTATHVMYDGPASALESDENAILESECRFITPDDELKDGTLFLTDQDRIVFVIPEDKRHVRDHNYQISSVTNVRVENKQSDNASLAVDWKYDDQVSFEELTYRYESLDDPEKWKRKILKIKDTTSPTSHRRKAKGTSKSAKQFCISCSSALPKGSKYCNKCGAQQP
jgi:hypothetical protein